MRPRLEDAVSAAVAPVSPGSETVRAALAASGGRRETLACLAVLAVAFALDRIAPLWGQIAAGAVAWAFALTLLHRASGTRRRLLFACLAWATAGELFCSLGWGLYTYRLGNIPHFVPPGHILVLLIGLHLAQRMSLAVADRLTAAFAVLTFCAAVFLGDEFSVLLFAIYFTVYLLKPGMRGLLATMFLLTLALELIGTSLGTWAWAPRAPVLGLATTNPPFAVAAFYCMLDTLVLWTLRGGPARLAAALPRLAFVRQSTR
jgi:hypothetical protein